LIGIVNASAPVYAGYSYRHAADRYRCLLTAGSSVRLRAAAQDLRHPTLRARIQSERFEAVEAYTAR